MTCVRFEFLIVLPYLPDQEMAHDKQSVTSDTGSNGAVIVVSMGVWVAATPASVDTAWDARLHFKGDMATLRLHCPPSTFFVTHPSKYPSSPSPTSFVLYTLQYLRANSPLHSPIP